MVKGFVTRMAAFLLPGPPAGDLGNAARIGPVVLDHFIYF